jgi:uncharacterized membrane protein
MRSVVFGFAAIAVVCGLFFRFSHLERKYYYDDEVVSSLRESGHTIADFGALFDGRVRTSAEVALLLADRSTKPSSTIASLAAEDSQHPPLFYLMNRYWTQIFGDDQANRRSLAAVFGSLAILAVFWLGLSLFKDAAFAAISAGFIALSPFEILYSQQNREYSAWLFFLALSGALLLRALRKPTWGAWITYCGTIVLSLYTAVFLFLFDVVAFAVYTMIAERMPNRMRFLVATAVALAAYLPWLLALHQGSQEVRGAAGQTLQAVSPKIYLFKWMFNTGAVFFDMEFNRTSLVWILGVVLIVVVASFIVLAKTADWRATLFISALAFGPAAIVVLDVVYKASRGTVPRYLLPVWLGCDLAVAYLIGWLIFSQRRPAWRIAGAAMLIGFFAGGLASAYNDSLAKATWVGAHMSMIGHFAAVINATRDPLVVYVHDGKHLDISALGLTTVLHPDVRMQFFSSLDSTKIRQPDFFLFNATDATEAEIERQLGGKWVRFDAQTAGSALVRQLQSESNSDRAKRTLPADAQESPLWERLPS